MNLKTLAVACGFWVSLSSCATLQPLAPPSNLRPVQKGNLASLNGRYAASGSSTGNLGSILLPGKNAAISSGEKQVVIKALDNRHLQICLFDEVGRVAERVCKVSVQQGYCRLKTYRHYFSEIVIVNGYYSSVARIALLQNGNLTVDEAGGGMHFVLILPVVFPESFHRNSQLEFKRIGD